MKKTKYELIGYKEIKVCMLEPHPAAEMPIDEEDSFSIESSVGEIGMIQPLLVTAETHKHSKGGQCHLILDGVNRWKKADALGIQEVPCLLVKCQDPRRVVLECLSTGRKRTTGQRIMAYLEQHKKDVLDAYDINAKKGENFRKLSIPHGDRMDVMIHDFSAESIAEKLHCSHTDVLSGIDLMIAWDEAKADDKETDRFDNIDEQRLRIYAGSSGIRRWKAALGGKTTTKGKKRKDPDYSELVLPTAVTLTNAFQRWTAIKWQDQTNPRFSEEVAMKQLESLFSALPDALRRMLAVSIIPNWPEHDKRTLLKALKG